jgi:hypothetical protein
MSGINRKEHRQLLRSKRVKIARGDYDRHMSRAFKGIVSKPVRDVLGKVVRARHAS